MHTVGWAEVPDSTSSTVTLGPTRNGVAARERIADSFPAGGPKTVWQRPVGRGFAGVAVAEHKLFVAAGGASYVAAPGYLIAYGAR